MRLSPKQTQRIAWVVLWVMGLWGVFLPVFIVVYVLAQGIPAIDWDFFTTEPKGGLSGEGGISSVIITTLWLVGTTLVVTVPLGVGAAIYLAEYARDTWLTEVDRLRLGPFEMTSVPGVIIPSMPGDQVLLGMSFLKYLSLMQEGESLTISLPE